MTKKVAKKQAAARKTAAARKQVKRSGVANKAAVKGKAPRVSTAAEVVDAQELAHGLNSLLHTMQTVQQFEEALCSLMHALRRGRATGALVRDLRGVLEQLPAQDYLHEVHALRDALAA